MSIALGKNETCSLCKCPALVIQAIKRADKFYHRECLACRTCKCRLEEGPTLKEDVNGYFYCVTCYMELPSDQKIVRRTSELSLAHSLIWGAVPKCVVCSKVVYSQDLRCWGGKVYHRGDCFRCSECAKVLEDTSVCEQGREQPCCRSCWNKGRRTATAAFNPVRCVCAACNLECNRLKSNVAEVGQQVYHSACLRCFQCDKQLDPERMMMNGANCYCRPCYNKQFTHNALAQAFKSSSACVECGKEAYAQETIRLLGKVYHASCLKCDGCCKKLDYSMSETENGKLYCRGCHTRIFKPQTANSTFDFGGSVEKCGACDKACYAMERVQIDSAVFHPSCIRCSSCKVPCKAINVGIVQGKFYCLQWCYKIHCVGRPNMADVVTRQSSVTRQSVALEEATISANSDRETRCKQTDMESVKKACEKWLQQQQRVVNLSSVTEKCQQQRKVVVKAKGEFSNGGNRIPLQLSIDATRDIKPAHSTEGDAGSQRTETEKQAEIETSSEVINLSHTSDLKIELEASAVNAQETIAVQINAEEVCVDKKDPEDACKESLDAEKVDNAEDIRVAEANPEEARLNKADKGRVCIDEEELVDEVFVDARSVEALE